MSVAAQLASREAAPEGGGLRRAARNAVGRTHSGLTEILVLAFMYGVYEVIRGVRHTDLELAKAHAADIVRLEEALHAASERGLQRVCERVPLLSDAFAFLYPGLHVAGTIGALYWLFRCRRGWFPFVRTSLIAMTALALLVYVLYPVAPPRLAGGGFVDVVSRDSPLDLSSRVLGPLYNPVAAVPSLHFAYALLVGCALLLLARPPVLRAAGAVYPVLTLLVIVATANHYFFDAATGAGVALAGGVVAWAVGIVPPPRARTGLVVVDMLDEFVDGRLGSERSRAIVPAVCKLIRHAAKAGWPVAVVCDAHHPTDPELRVWGPHAMAGTPEAEMQRDVREAAAAVRAQRFEKTTYDAFRDGRLGPWLRRRDVDRVVLAGTATHICVAQTAIGAMVDGFHPVVVTDACAAFPDVDEAFWHAYLAEVAGAELVDVESLTGAKG